MTMNLVTEAAASVIPIIPVREAHFETWLTQQPTSLQTWVHANKFKGKPHSVCLVPNAEGELKQVLTGLTHYEDPWSFAHLPSMLPEATFQIRSAEMSDDDLARAAFAWGLANYQFERYTRHEKYKATLLIPPSTHQSEVGHLIEAIAFIRDLINTPANDMGPEALESAAKKLASRFQASCQTVYGDALTTHFPSIDAVGRAGAESPRLIDLTWGDEQHPKLTLVGKGVAFDSGGLNLKPGNAMRLMKKDMGGSAHVLGLAHCVMALQLPVRLRVLIPAVYNSISRDAFQPGDVIKSRSGSFIEIGNTDAEGRVVLADALTAATEESPDLLIDYATLTGAARVALGTDVPVYFCNNQALADQLQQSSHATCDPIWQLPLHTEYRELIKSNIADLCNDSSSRYGGAITAALFLEHFIKDCPRWIHIDLMAWNTSSRPGRPEGGEAMAFRCMLHLLKQRYGGV